VRQQTLASQAGFVRYGKKTRREKFLEEMDSIMPWSELASLIEPHYPKAGNGRPPVGLGIMLRIYFLQHWFNLSDPAEEALYDSPALRRFAGVDLGRAAAPDETTILSFRHLLERHDLCGAMLDAVNHYLAERGIRIGAGTIMDATIIHAPSSTKNAAGTRDPAMHQTRKGNQWYFGMKAHIRVDSRQGHVHSVCSSAASVADKHMLPDLLHGEERKVWGDCGYQGQGEAIRKAVPHAQDMTSRRTRYKQVIDELQRRKNRTKAPSESEGRTSFPHPEARVRICESALPQLEEEPRSPVRRLCAGGPLPAPQTVGPAGGVVCPRARRNRGSIAI
jgi:IS5 family transposase